MDVPATTIAVEQTVGFAEGMTAGPAGAYCEFSSSGDECLAYFKNQRRRTREWDYSIVTKLEKEFSR